MYALFYSMRKLFFITVLLFSVNLMLGAQATRPVPHEVVQEGRKTLNVSRGVVLMDPAGVFADACGFLKLKDKGTILSVTFGSSAAASAGVREIPGAYRLDITSKGITVIGYDETGAFYGLQTLRQMVETSEDRRIPCCTVNDWPDETRRGFVDSFHGSAWSHSFRISMADLAARLKMNEYVYAPESDPYVAGEDWYMPYPQGNADDLKELMEACSRNRVVFTWCVRPDAEFAWSDTDFSLLLGKFEMMYFMGVRSFGVFFDDIPYFDGIEDKKQEIIDRLNSEFISRKKGVGPLLTSPDGYYVSEHGQESLKLGLYGIADRSWNADAFDPMVSLKWAAGELAPDVADAYVTYAIHSDVSPKAFAMDESASLELIGIERFSADEYDALMEEFRKIENVPSAFSATSSKALYDDLKPWAVEFGKLGARCRRILECITHYRSGDIPAFWSTYASNLMSDDDRNAYLEHPSGTARLQPYYERMMKVLAEAFDNAYKDAVGYTFIPGDGIQTYIAPDEASLCHLVLDNPQQKEVIVRLSDRKGRYTAEFCIETSYFEFEMKEDAVKVEVIGNVPVFETVFVK